MAPQIKKMPKPPSVPPPAHMRIAQVHDSDTDDDDWGEWLGDKKQTKGGCDTSEAAIKNTISNWATWQDPDLHAGILEAINSLEAKTSAKRAELQRADKPTKQTYWKRRGTSTRAGA